MNTGDYIDKQSIKSEEINKRRGILKWEEVKLVIQDMIDWYQNNWAMYEANNINGFVKLFPAWSGYKQIIPICE